MIGEAKGIADHLRSCRTASDVDVLRNLDGILPIEADIAHRALGPGMS